MCCGPKRVAARREHAGARASQARRSFPHIFRVRQFLRTPRRRTPVHTTAWGDGLRFVDQGNWGMYLAFTVQDCDPIIF